MDRPRDGVGSVAAAGAVGNYSPGGAAVVSQGRKPLGFGTAEEKPLENLRVPSAWNHLESGILFAIGLPLLVFCEDGISDGIFDHGVSGAFVHKMPPPSINPSERNKWTAVFQKWQAAVRHRYYQL